MVIWVGRWEAVEEAVGEVVGRGVREYVQVDVRARAGVDVDWWVVWLVSGGEMVLWGKKAVPEPLAACHCWDDRPFANAPSDPKPDVAANCLFPREGGITNWS